MQSKTDKKLMCHLVITALTYIVLFRALVIS